MPPETSFVFILFLVFVGAALAAALALFARQALIIGYIAVGVLLGPWGLAWVNDTDLIADMSEVGIIFLLFLLGLNLTPQKLLVLLRQTTVVTLLTSVIFCLAGWGTARAFGFPWVEALLIGVATMFSSTIIGIKLLPTTVLHHKHTGEVIISVLLLQDLIAIGVLLTLQGLNPAAPDPGADMLGTNPLWDVARVLVGLPLLAAVAWALERWVLLPLFKRFDRVTEFVFLLTIAWCLGIAELGHALGLSYEIGAFIAGIIVASSPISLFIAESLKPLRDFFLVLFFFALGASLNLELAGSAWMPALALAAVMLALKPVVFRFALGRVAETPRLAWETGWRLGQMSEFALLITYVAMQSPVIGDAVVFTIQLATIITFVGSTTLIVLRYPTPVSPSERLRRD